MTPPVFTPIIRGGFRLDTTHQEILLEVIRNNGKTTQGEIARLVQAQCRAPGPHAEAMASLYLLALSRAGVLERPLTGDTWMLTV